MIRKILVYENVLAAQYPAIERALRLAQHCKVELKIVDVFEGVTKSLRGLNTSLRETLEQERAERLHSLCTSLSEQGISSSSQLLRGRPFVEIVREVVQQGFHLVIKTATGVQASELVGPVGPIDMRLVRNCPCPVWLEVSDRPVGCDRILVAIDPHADDHGMNHVLLEVASSLARAMAGELCVAAAWQVPDEELIGTKLNSDQITRYVADVQALAQTQLTAALATLDPPLRGSNLYFEKGKAAETILESLVRFQADIIVMGAVGQANVRGLQIGDTADTVLRNIDRSVLVVRRDSLFRA